MPSSLTLWIAFPRIAGNDFPLVNGRYVAGRATECELVVSHPTVSRRHAEIVVDQASVPNGGTEATQQTPRVTVVDLHSRNGTFVDGKRVERCEVRRGQWVEFGGVRFLLESSDFHSGWLGECEMEGDSPTELAEFVNKPLPANAARGTAALAALSRAQFRVYQLLLGGLSNKQIAARLALSQHTVHNHLRAIYRTLNVHSRAELFANHLNDTLDGS